jgi:uncharacterized protein
MKPDGGSCSKCDVPSVNECLGIMDKYQMMPNIRRHSLMVARVAFILGEALNRRSSDLNMKLILAGALLHDIAKTRSLREGGNHVELGEKMVLEMGYPEVASIVAQHVGGGSEIADTIDEAAVVNYADKRVQHDRIVPLRDRFEDLVARYGKTGERRSRLRKMGRNAQRLEGAICSRISVTSDELEEIIEKAHAVVLSDCG